MELETLALAEPGVPVLPKDQILAKAATRLCAQLWLVREWKAAKPLLVCGRDQVFEEVEQVVAANHKIMRVRAVRHNALSL